jgi:hypothetical protein
MTTPRLGLYTELVDGQKAGIKLQSFLTQNPS